MKTKTEARVLALVAQKTAAGGHLTVAEAADELSVSRKSVRSALRHWKEKRAIHIAEFKAVRWGYEQLWRLGSGDDAPMPDRVSRTKASQERRMAAAREGRVIARLQEDARPWLDVWVCPNLGALPHLPYARP